MRSDMFKVIVEKERRGSGMKSDTKMSRKYWKGSRPKRGSFKEDTEDWEEDEKLSHLPKKITGRKPQGWDRKSLNENLSPLKKFLFSRVGRKWDDVWSEVCENINSNSTVQKHVLDHARDYVVTDCYYDAEGKVWYNSPYHGPELVSPVEYAKYGNHLYVEPGTGILRKTTIIHVKKKEKKKPINRIDLGYNKQLHKVDGIWYEVALKEIPRHPLVTDYNATGHFVINNYGQIRDVLLNMNLYSLAKDRRLIDETYGSHWYYLRLDSPTTMRAFLMNDGLVYAAGKKQLNKKDLKKYGLK